MLVADARGQPVPACSAQPQCSMMLQCCNVAMLFYDILRHVYEVYVVAILIMLSVVAAAATAVRVVYFVYSRYINKQLVSYFGLRCRLRILKILMWSRVCVCCLGSLQSPLLLTFFLRPNNNDITPQWSAVHNIILILLWLMYRDK